MTSHSSVKQSASLRERWEADKARHVVSSTVDVDVMLAALDVVEAAQTVTDHADECRSDERRGWDQGPCNCSGGPVRRAVAAWDALTDGSASE